MRLTTMKPWIKQQPLLNHTGPSTAWSIITLCVLISKC